MRHPHTNLATASSSNPRSRELRGNDKTVSIGSRKRTTKTRELIENCYRTVLETSSSAIMLLSPDSIILGWNRSAEAISGWITNEVLGRSYVELFVPKEARAPFMMKLAQVTSGKEVRGLKIPLQARTGSRTMLSWNISRVLGTHGNLIGLMAIGSPVIPDTGIEEEFRLAYTQLLTEARRAEKVAEAERCRISRELHDEFGQTLTGLKFDLSWFSKKLSQAPAPTDSTHLLNKIQAMSGSVDALLESLHATVAALRPAMLDDLGLVPALECLAATFQLRTGVQCALDVAPDVSSLELPSETSTALFRVAQELLTNVMRHAAASQVRMRLCRSVGHVTLEVTDNGKGIPNERATLPHSFGLRGMHERASLLGGHFHIAGSSRAGTTACLSLPIAGYGAP